MDDPLLYLGPYQDTPCLMRCDTLITDPPFSEKTHSGHNAQTQSDDADRKALGYDHWTPEQAREFVRYFHPLVKNWIVIMCDHILAPHYADEPKRMGRYVFAPVPWVAPGSRVRLQGDGPACWTCQIVVARPKEKRFMGWGALPGAYVVNAERNTHGITGSKPLALMRRILWDYSKPGDVICDPCAGSGTTLVAALQEGRRAIGAEIDPKTHAIAKARLVEEIRWVKKRRTRNGKGIENEQRHDTTTR